MEKSVTSAPIGYPEIYEHIWSLSNDVLQKNSVESSGSIAFEVSEEFRRQAGGRHIYFSKHEPSEFLRSISFFAISILQQRGFEADAALKIGSQIAKILDESFHSVVYFPFAEVFDKIERNRKIYSEFKGNNLREVASKYKLTQMQVRNILKKQCV
jgi:Mor family transcriptional regulator